MVCYDGWFYGLELKVSRNVPSNKQIYQLDRIQRAGGIAVVLYDSGFDLFKKTIDTIPQGKIWRFRKNKMEEIKFERFETD